ncbi:Protein of unknown function [Cotesia congregata]|uniref:Uncharacterized protein n=1 Tax=Cotesia congregata TaxID=51543 RepID=A0A8J2HGT7_COTCN|nr:Protein of unknown function [Cotesia congregata]
MIKQILLTKKLHPDIDECNEIIKKGVSYRIGDGLFISQEGYQYKVVVGKICKMLNDENEIYFILEISDTKFILYLRAYQLGEMLEYKCLSFSELIYMEDFTEVDDDEILQDLASKSKEQLVLILVPDGIDWNGDLSTKNSQVSKEQSETVTEPSPSSSEPISSQQASDLDNIYCKLSSSVQKSLRTGKFLDFNEKKTLIHVVANYMTNDCNDTTLTTAKKMGHRIVNNYSASFTVKIGGFSLEGASASLGQKIYDRINYAKQGHHDNRTSQSYSLEDLEDSTKKPKTQDEYGCVAYLPELPQNESWESQEEKRLALINDYESSKPKFKKKNKGKDIPDELRHIFNKQKKAKEYSITLKNKRPYKNILFDFINQYIGSREKLEFLYVLINEDTEDDKLLDFVDVPNPVLIIRGNGIHNDSSNKYNVVIEKSIIIGANSFLDGILITFLTYFIFGFVYSPEIEGTLEIIQRCV